MAKLTLYSCNVNGIRAVIRKASLTGFIANYQPEILCVQETKTVRDHEDIELPGYQQFWNSAVKPGYSGTARFTKVNPLPVTNAFPDDFSKKYKFADTETRDAANEGRVLPAEFD